MIHRRKQAGSAIIVALFVVALVATLATMMIARLGTDIRRTELILEADTAYLYAQGSIQWAIATLRNNWEQQQPNQVIDKTPIHSPLDKESGTTIESTIYDAQGYFNINNVSDVQYQTNFTRLVQIIAPTIDPAAAQDLTQAIMDWIGTPSQNTLLGDIYLKSVPSYQAPHRFMVSISELRLVKGMTPTLFTKLAPYLIALPQTTAININHASAPLLMSLSMTLNMATAKAIVARTQQTPFATLQDFLNLEIVKSNLIDANKITTQSSYFLVVTNVTVKTQHYTWYTLLIRTVKDKNANVMCVWQSKGTL